MYHYFGSKEGVLLAVMERGAQRYLAAVPDFDRRIGSRQEHLQVVVETASSLLERQPDFLRILIVMAAQPMSAGDGEVHRVVNRMRELALQRLREQMEIVFALDPKSGSADHLARLRWQLSMVRSWPTSPIRRWASRSCWSTYLPRW